LRYVFPSTSSFIFHTHHPLSTLSFAASFGCYCCSSEQVNVNSELVFVFWLFSLLFSDTTPQTSNPMQVSGGLVVGWVWDFRQMECWFLNEKLKAFTLMNVKE
jgi:hypothetical protein